MNISNKIELQAAIIELEKRRLLQESDMKEHFQAVKKSLSPLTMIKNGIRNLAETPDIKEGVLKTLTGLGVGILSKKLFIGSSPTMIKKLLSGVFELAVAKTTISNADKVKAYGISLYNNLFKKSSSHSKVDENN